MAYYTFIFMRFLFFLERTCIIVIGFSGCAIDLKYYLKIYIYLNYRYYIVCLFAVVRKSCLREIGTYIIPGKKNRQKR